MKYWRIENISKQSIKFICKTSSNSSKGVVLKTNEFCLVEPLQTSFIESQLRKGFINIEKDFDNSKLLLEISTPYSIETIKIPSAKSKMKEAEERAKRYISNKK